jgi:hypothetical protein
MLACVVTIGCVLLTKERAGRALTDPKLAETA